MSMNISWAARIISTVTVSAILASCGGRDESALKASAGARIAASPVEQYPTTTDSAGASITPSLAEGLDGSGESYNRIYENDFLTAINNPLSTFAIDVDRASYSNVRRYINDGSIPPVDAVRVEELINYFTYDYPQPRGEEPFSVTTEVARCPWNPEHKLVQIGVQGKSLDADRTPPSNLVFLIDASGSMDQPDKLPLLKKAFKFLVEQLRPQDRVAIVTYAGEAGLVLPSTPGAAKGKIIDAIDDLEAGGSTAGGAGIQLAYSVAIDNYIGEGNNRVILATDGDFNVGVSSEAELVSLIEEKRRAGVFLTVLGFGSENLQDSKMEQLADNGNGSYAYIDGINEARKVFINELSSTLHTIAKDVKIQVEFNPAKVRAYRLVGYENRALAAHEFNDDAKDAGELGAGHTVTALYEIVPADASAGRPRVDRLKYQSSASHPELYGSDEIMTVKLRYKQPKGETSMLTAQPVIDGDKSIHAASNNLKFSAAVAEWGMLLRNSKYTGRATFNDVLQLARDAKGEDAYGLRAEFISLVEASRSLMQPM